MCINDRFRKENQLMKMLNAVPTNLSQLRVRSVTATTLICMTAALLAGCPKQSERPSEQSTGSMSGRLPDIKIAAAAPITGSQADVGNDLINGIKLAVNEANQAGGLLGRKIDLQIVDDAADPKEAVSVANKLAAQQDIVGLVGHMNSGTTKPAAEVYNQAGLPVVMPVPTNPEITQRGFNNLFRIPPTDLAQGVAGAKFALAKLGKKRFAIIHDKTDYGKPLAEVVRKTVDAQGGQVVAFEGITEGDKDFRAVLTKVKQAKPDVLYFGGIYNEGGLIAKQANELGLKVQFLSADGCYSSKFIALAGKGASEGAIMSFIAPPAGANPAMKQFASRFIAKYGAINAFAPNGYDATKVLLEGIKRANSTDKAAIIKALHDPSFAFNGATGRITFAVNGDNKNDKLFFYRVTNGKFAPV
jgi:branched-chain amino acid transport system substrate-binding protein